MRWIWAGFGILLAIPVALYAVNPFGVASYDPRERVFGYGTYRIAAASMAPSLMPGDYLLTSSAAYRDALPRRGDVIVFLFPEDRSVSFVKRVIALPGETVSIVSGAVLIDGQPIDEPYLLPEMNVFTSSRDMPPTKVSENSLFVLGDNRDNSRDSRYWGLLPLDDVTGQVKYIWMAEDTGRIGPV